MPCEIKVFGFPEDWQVPARTEMYAYESILKHEKSFDFIYVAFPWATLIDSLCSGAMMRIAKLLRELSKLYYLKDFERCISTVCQHIRCIEFISLFQACGITDLYFPHKLNKMEMIEGIRIHPFPLFPAQTFDLSNNEKVPLPLQDRKYLANFVGAYNPNIYLTDVRKHIFNDEGRYEDIYIVKRNSWHFDRQVYEEQIKGIPAQEPHKDIEKLYKEEYLAAIKNSVFTLCPTGSGPGSIRIYESIELGSIPVIITKDLHLPGPQHLWEKSCVIVEDSLAGYREALEIMRAMGSQERRDKLESLRELGSYVLPDSYGSGIIKSLNAHDVPIQEAK